MKMKRLRRIYVGITVLMVCLVLALGPIHTAYAYYSFTGSVRNTLTTTGSNIYLQELFDPKDYWLPGETKTKEVNFGNGGDSNQVIRFRVEMQWRDAAGADWIPIASNPATINWTQSLTDDWSPIPSIDGKTWYYYNHVLLVGEETPPVMESVWFWQSLSNDDHAEDFTNTTYRIVIYLESLNVNSEVTNVEWGVVFMGESPLGWKLP